jgi:hypothetical protein
VSYTGAGFTPTAGIFIIAGTTATDNMAIGWADDSEPAGRSLRARTMTGTTVVGVVDNVMTAQDASNYQAAILKSWDADGCTLTWTKGGSGHAGTFSILFLK